jgi:hypothetical protein
MCNIQIFLCKTIITLLTLATLGNAAKNRIAASINVALPKVTKASVVLVSIGAIFTRSFVINLSNGNTALGLLVSALL